eukprot:TRINITY_DN15926_c0_g1_i1.p1 TRINITY_DN15926_c0_g1~~TRINITY_DN15926_c0_g1_i1.p1  ORF type:complete len:310 (-),score=33.92 TRINITY_DN15926_c0_g1_i1:195-1124(-)
MNTLCVRCLCYPVATSSQQVPSARHTNRLQNRNFRLRGCDHTNGTVPRRRACAAMSSVSLDEGQELQVPPSTSSEESDLSSSPMPSEGSSGFIKRRIAVFVSGGGSNFRAIHASMKEGKIYGEVVAVVSDKPECGGCAYAVKEQIPVLPFPRSAKFAPEGLSAEDLVISLRRLSVDYVVLAGFLKLLPAELLNAYPRAILNIHPALLPAFGGKGYYGMKVHEAVVRSGARFSGPTVHFIDEKYDNGPIVAQRIVPVLPFDTPADVQARVLAQEHSLYSHVLAALCEDRITWREDGIPLIRKAWDDCEYL